MAHRLKKYSCLGFCVCVLICFSSFNRTFIGDEQKARQVLNDLFTAVGKVETMKWSLKVIERIKGKQKHYGSAVKLRVKPVRKLYINIKGTEVLWVQGTNNGKALVHANIFPINVNLDPMGSLMRDEQHHTIYEMGFVYLSDIVRQIVAKSGDKFDEQFKYLGEEERNNVKCNKISISVPNFSYVNYTVLKGENVISIARKLYVAEYLIMENNKKIDDYKDVKEGDVIKVPTAYAKNVIMYIDKLYNVPIGIVVYDDKGLYEQYDYHFLQVNPKITDEEFTRQFKDYKF
jgi:LysM repeat protein